MSELADEAWGVITRLVSDSRGDYRRAVIAEVGMPFSRVRVITRLADGPLTLKALADAATMDAPATTVAVADLEARGLVAKVSSESSGREKLVSLTSEGNAVLERVRAFRQPAPRSIEALSDAQLEQLLDLLTEREL